ncbi:glycoside hydrolase [Teratosphaeria nubilosa]|uniref:Glycoside hydrolase n=1 Tax=Teratosphaeria nubilosa TaxID=161662 RepID=A0A6G1LPW6_9PEZI|nr:glycoside hydrolase [Teratosphaeria nubilosa]
MHVDDSPLKSTSPLPPHPPHPPPTHLTPANPALAPRLVTYIQTFHYTNNTPLSLLLLPLLTQHTRITHVNLAALHINDDALGTTLNDENPNASAWDQTWAEVRELQGAGVKVLMMMGGAAQGSYGKVHESYYQPLLSTLRYHNLDGLDLGIEEPVSRSCPLARLNRLSTDLGPDFVLTMAPVASALLPDGPGLSGFDYVALDQQAVSSTRPTRKLVDWYNAQFYNGRGDARTQVFYDAVVALGGNIGMRVGVLVSRTRGSGCRRLGRRFLRRRVCRR